MNIDKQIEKLVTNTRSGGPLPGHIKEDKDKLITRRRRAVELMKEGKSQAETLTIVRKETGLGLSSRFLSKVRKLLKKKSTPTKHYKPHNEETTTYVQSLLRGHRTYGQIIADVRRNFPEHTIGRSTVDKMRAAMLERPPEAQ